MPARGSSTARRRNASGRAGTTRSAEGGGLALDMMAHWRYMIDRLAAPITGVCALMTTAIPERVDEQRAALHGRCRGHHLTRCCKLQGGAVGVITNSWATRPRRDDTMVVQIDGTTGSAVAGRFRCFTQSAVEHARGLLRGRAPGRRRPDGALAGSAGHAATQAIPSASAGKRSCAMSARMRPICRLWSKARRPCSSPTSPIAASPSSAG